MAEKIMTTKDIKKLCSAKTRFSFFGRQTIKVKEEAVKSIRTGFSKGLKKIRDKVEAIKENIETIKDKAEAIKENIELKKEQINNFVYEESLAAINKRNEKYEVKYNDKQYDILKAQQTLKENKENISSEDYEVIEKDLSSQLEKNEEKMIKRTSKGLVIHELSFIALKKLAKKNNAKMRKSFNEKKEGWNKTKKEVISEFGNFKEYIKDSAKVSNLFNDFEEEEEEDFSFGHKDLTNDDEKVILEKLKQNEKDYISKQKDLLNLLKSVKESKSEKQDKLHVDPAGETASKKSKEELLGETKVEPIKPSLKDTWEDISLEEFKEALSSYKPYTFEDLETVDNKLKLQEKVDKLQEEFDRLYALKDKHSMGRRVFININGRKIDFPVKFASQIRNVNGLLKKSKEELELLNNPTIASEPAKEKIEPTVKKQVQGVRKSKNLDKIKLAALTAILAISLSMGSGYGSSQVSDQNPVQETIGVETPSTPIYGEQTSFFNDNDYVFPEKETVKEETPVVAVETTTLESTGQSVAETISLGDKATLKEETPIYISAEYASKQENARTRTFQNNDARKISGIVYDVNGQSNFVYINQQNATEMINEYKNAGGTVSAVQISNDYGIEGYMNINDIDAIENIVEKGYSR